MTFSYIKEKDKNMMATCKLHKGQRQVCIAANMTSTFSKHLQRQCANTKLAAKNLKLSAY